MKRVLISILFLLAGCSGSESPVNPATSSTSSELPKPFERGSWSGTFEILGDDGSGGMFTQKGTIFFTFFETTYEYTGEITSGSGGVSNILNEQGSYHYTSEGVYLYDRANLYGSIWAPSLYLNGAHLFKVEGSTLTITQANAGRTVTLVLQRTSSGR